MWCVRGRSCVGVCKCDILYNAINIYSCVVYAFVCVYIHVCGWVEVQVVTTLHIWNCCYLQQSVDKHPLVGITNNNKAYNDPPQ